jgi:hypothetical protein
MTLDEWIALAREAAARRGLPELPPLIDGLRDVTRQLREAEWNTSMAASPSSTGHSQKPSSERRP